MTLYEQHMQKLKDKYGVPDGRLETDNRPAPLTITLPVQGPTVSRHERNHIQGFKDKYNLPNGLETEGMAVRRETTLEDYITEKEREAYKGMKLAVGSTSYKGKPVRIWFTIGR